MLVIKDGKVIITLDAKKLAPSKSGKTLIVATTNGFMKTDIEHEGRPVSISVNVCVPVAA